MCSWHRGAAGLYRGVPAQRGFVGEGPAAGVAHEGLLAGVDAVVPLQRVQLRELLPTLVTAVRPLPWECGMGDRLGMQAEQSCCASAMPSKPWLAGNGQGKHPGGTNVVTLRPIWRQQAPPSPIKLCCHCIGDSGPAQNPSIPSPYSLLSEQEPLSCSQPQDHSKHTANSLFGNRSHFPPSMDKPLELNQSSPSAMILAGY